MQDTITERLHYFINDNGNQKGTIAMVWGKLKVEIPFTIRH